MNFIEHLQTYFGKEETASLIAALDQKPQKAALLNKNKITDAEFTHLFSSSYAHPLVSHAFIYDNDIDHPGLHFLHDAGAYYLQEPSALSVASFLPLAKNDYVLDIAAAPGGKSIQTALRLQALGGGTLVSNDLSGLRALELSRNIERMGLDNVIVTNADINEIFPIKKIFQRIILDAPCSGSGMFRKNDAMEGDWSEAKVAHYQKIQKTLITQAYQMLLPGGHLLYSTCSFSRDENEDIISFLLQNSDAELINFTNNHLLVSSPILPQTKYFLPSHFPGEGQFVALIYKPGQLLLNANPVLPKHTFFNHNLNLHLLDRPEAIYGLSSTLELSRDWHIIRYGVRLAEHEKNRLEPAHHLAHYLLGAPDIILNDTERIAYLHGETIKRNLTDGYYTIGTKSIIIGWAKYSGGQLKNRYPKGLRH